MCKIITKTGLLKININIIYESHKIGRMLINERILSGFFYKEREFSVSYNV